MSNYEDAKQALLAELASLHHRLELSKTVGSDYFEPGLMEFLDQSEGLYDAESGRVLLRFEARGTRYEGRTELIEHVRIGDTVKVVRDRENPFNANNFTLQTASGKSLGHMPAEICNAMAPLFDDDRLHFEHAEVSYVEPISKRSRHARQAVLFVQLTAVLS